MHTIILPTNYNGKLHCQAMLHIAPAPKEFIRETAMNQPYQVITKDDSHPPVTFYLKDIARMKLLEIPDCYTWASHAMRRFEFVTWYSGEYKVFGDNDMAVYFYHRQPQIA